ncbi:hypothetical protein NDU88_006382 [Pleurodeles waltl]|uniref:Uncharacterized protein n=1 Tax=Pleurodeles waltl TaxID=8319 RepID=A0AAV7U069_PLEWA|nr:hypothetical protein NDU88_006382 [Pleurodeles waltl]
MQNGAQTLEPLRPQTQDPAAIPHPALNRMCGLEQRASSRCPRTHGTTEELHVEKKLCLPTATPRMGYGEDCGLHHRGRGSAGAPNPEVTDLRLAAPEMASPTEAKLDQILETKAATKQELSTKVDAVAIELGLL